MSQMLIDSHCHLDYLERDGQNLDDVVTRAADAGVGCMVTISTKMSSFPEVLKIAERYDNIFCSVGVHPHAALEEGPLASKEKLIELAQHPKVVAIGETGLDYYYENSPREAQKESFVAHIEASRDTQLPIIIHTRDADEDTMEILESEMEKGAFPGLIHCFSSSQELAHRSVAIGFSISLSGIITFKTAADIRNSVDSLDLESLLVETDAPFLAPVPLRGKKNEPAFVKHTAEKLADIKLQNFDTVAEITTNNFFNLFDKIDRTKMNDLWNNR